MKKLLALTAGAFVATTAFAADADAFERRSTVTGPAGNQVHTQGSIKQTGPGQWERQRTITGPSGNTATLGATGSCSGGECNINRSRTGPAGNTVGRSTTIRRY